MIGNPIPRIGVVSPGENLKRHILAMGQGVDILKTAPSGPLSNPLLFDDPQFQGLGGETTSIPLRPRLTGYVPISSNPP